jgi:hypothetical protein
MTQAQVVSSINAGTLVKLDNYEMLEIFGMITKFDGGMCKLADNIVVLKDADAPVFIGHSKIFPLSEIFTGRYFTSKELKQALKDKEGDLRYLRVFLSYFYPQEDGRLSQKQDYWNKFKSWRYDIDDSNYTLEQVLELINKLPLKPNIIKKSNKGWHLIYVFDRFIEREDVEAYIKNKNNDDAYKPYIVYEILTKLLPFYLKELEPKLDVGASNNISQIATRFISERLPAYIINPEYSLDTFIEAYSFLTKKVFDEVEEELEISGKSIFTIQSIPKEEFYTAISRCGVLKALEEDWENHSYNEWFVMFNYYAVKCLYADNQEELEKIINEFHEKSRRHPKYTYKDAEYHLNNAIKKQREGLKLPGCRFINKNINPKYLEACKSCSYKKVDKDGNIYSHFIYSYLNQESLEDIALKGWVLRENGWSIYNAEDGSYIQVLPYFKIRTHYIVGEAEDEYVEIVDKRSRSYIRKVDRKKGTYKPDVNLVKSFGAVNPDKIREAERFLAHYIEKVKVKRGVKIDFVGYKNIGNGWDIVVGGNGKYSRKEISFIFYGKEMENSDWYIPEVKGSEEYFKAIYQALFSLNDAPLHLTIGHFLSWIGREFIKDRSLIANINPILILVGDTGTGKSIRVKLATALYGNPNLFSFTNITQAGFNNNFPLIKTPFGIDEVIMKTANDERKFGELVYNLTNIQGKMTFNTTYNPIDVPVVITGETENLLIDKAFDSFRGLNRRSIVIEMSDRWKENSDVLDDALSELQSHHGHILGYVKSLKEEDKKEIADLIKGIQARLDFGDSSFKDLKKHLALSLAMYYHFFERYIGMDAVDVADKVNAVIDFVAEQINKKQVVKIGENVDYVEEVINFISKVEEAMNNKKSLKGMSYKQVCNTIKYTPSNRIGELLKKFFWKRYTESSGSGSKLRFIPGVLIFNFFLANDEKAFVIQTDKDRLEALTEEELKIWADVLKIRYGGEVIEKIVEEIGDKRLKEVLKIDSKKEKREEEVEI